jgi:hypothetical protein
VRRKLRLQFADVEVEESGPTEEDISRIIRLADSQKKWWESADSLWGGNQLQISDDASRSMRQREVRLNINRYVR